MTTQIDDKFCVLCCPGQCKFFHVPNQTKFCEPSSWRQASFGGFAWGYWTMTPRHTSENQWTWRQKPGSSHETCHAISQCEGKYCHWCGFGVDVLFYCLAEAAGWTCCVSGHNCIFFSSWGAKFGGNVVCHHGLRVWDSLSDPEWSTQEGVQQIWKTVPGLRLTSTKQLDLVSPRRT